MPQQPTASSEAERRIYGELLPDVQLLRDRGHVVARFKGDYRIDNDVVSAAGLRARANEERKRSAKDDPKAPRPSTPQPKPIVEKPIPASAPVTLTCSKCGGPRSIYSSTGICRSCYMGGKQGAPGTPKVATAPAAAPAAPRSRLTNHPAPVAAPANPFDAPAALCGCGRPEKHLGRCWARRAQQGSNLVARVEALERQVAELMARAEGGETR